jgi:hypothetical protein
MLNFRIRILGMDPRVRGDDDETKKYFDDVVDFVTPHPS